MHFRCTFLLLTPLIPSPRPLFRSQRPTYYPLPPTPTQLYLHEVVVRAESAFSRLCPGEPFWPPPANAAEDDDQAEMLEAAAASAVGSNQQQQQQEEEKAGEEIGTRDSEADSKKIQVDGESDSKEQAEG